MSGDVQPRKRKDKRRKKDDAPGQEEPVVQPSTPTGNEDFNIHVHNDHGTGGGICAKLVFFVLLSVLAVLIGMIFIEKRGLTDLDIAPTESRFAKVFDGWIDESFSHDHEDDHAHAELEDHDDHDEHEEHEGSEEASLEEEEHDEHDEHEEEEEQQVSEEEHEEEEEEEEADEEQQVSEEADEETEEQASEEAEEEEHAASQEVEEETEEEQQETEEVEDDQAASEENQVSEEQQETEEAEDDQEASEEKQVSAEEEEEEEEEENKSVVDDVADDDDDNTDEVEAQASNEEDNEATADDNDDNDDDNEAADTNEDIDEKDDDDNTAEAEDDDNASNQVNEDDDNEEEPAADDDVSKENEIFEEDSIENTADIDGDDQEEEEEVVDNTAGEEDVLKEQAEKQEEVEEEESSSMAVKFGVGVALVVVAHVVLVRKWRSGKTSAERSIQEEEVVDLSRRNTIVPPAPLDQIENDIQNLDEDEYSEEEVEESEEELIIEPVPVKKSYQELQSTYSRTLPPENITSKSTLESKTSVQPRVVYYPRGASEEEEEEEEEEEDEEEVEEDNEEVEDEEEVEEGEDVEEVEEGDENEEEISDVDDDELLKKLEARYGKLPSTRDNRVDEGKEEKLGSWKKIKVLPDAEESEGSEDEHWAKKDSVPADLQQKLKNAEANLRNNPELAHKLFTNLMEQLPNNIQIKYGRAQALDQLAELKRSNQLLQDAISSYYDLLQSETISDKLYLKVAERCIDRIRFRGHYNRAVQLHKEIINRFPNAPSYRNQLAVTLLTSNRLVEAKPVLQEVLARWPDDGFALAHYGFILKTKYNDMEKAVDYLKRGIESRVPGVIDGRFYFHLGDALQRLGKNDEAMKVYEDGVNQKVFLSKYQRSLYNVDRLTAKPWWPLDQTPYASFFKLLEDKWETIRDEGLALLDTKNYFKDEAENLRDTGQWKQFELFARGQKFIKNCDKCPQTCSLIENLSDAKGCRRGQVKFSVMHPGTHVWPHCGPSNCRLRAHLGLKVPANTFIRVAEETRSWREGEVFLFDDSFEHEVWHNGSEVRLVLIVDVWHPELTAREKSSLPAI